MTDMYRKSDLSYLCSPLLFPILMIHLSIIFSEDYIIQLERPFLINSTMYLFLGVKYFSDALILLDTVFLFQILLISLIIYILR